MMSSSQPTVSYRTFSDNAAENYERYFVPAIGEPVARDLVERAALREGERVLDVACGTGIVARFAAEQVGATGTVAGLDVHPAMLAVARSVIPDDTTVDWHQASAEAMPLPDGVFDVVLCQMGLQFIADKAAALAEMRRVLAPGGRLLLNAPGPTPPPLAVIADALATHVAPEVAGFVHAVFSLHDPDAVRELLDAAGFTDVVVDHRVKTLRVPPPRDFLWQYVHSTPMAGALAQTDEAARAALEADVVERCQPYVDEDALIADVGMLTAIAHTT
jgi:ubiquinone/menaquinone biosynthesis C-methylase UbiE